MWDRRRRVYIFVKEAASGGAAASAGRRLPDSRSTFAFERFNLFLVHQPFAKSEQGELGERVGPRFALAFFPRFVELFVVGERVRIRPVTWRVDQCGPRRSANVANGFFADGVAFQRVGAIAFGDVKARGSFEPVSMLLPAVSLPRGRRWRSRCLRLDRKSGSFFAQAALSDSRNRLRLVAPSPEET